MLYPKKAAIYLELADATLFCAFIQGKQFVVHEFLLQNREVMQGRVYQPWVIAGALIELFKTWKIARPHVVVSIPLLGQKSAEEKELITLQTAMMISSAGAIIDSIIDTSLRQDNAFLHLSASGKSSDYLNSFKSP